MTVEQQASQDVLGRADDFSWSPSQVDDPDLWMRGPRRRLGQNLKENEGAYLAWLEVCEDHMCYPAPIFAIRSWTNVAMGLCSPRPHSQGRHSKICMNKVQDDQQPRAGAGHGMSVGPN